MALRVEPLLARWPNFMAVASGGAPYRRGQTGTLRTRRSKGKRSKCPEPVDGL